MLTVVLAVAIGLVGWSIYRTWTKGPWDLPVSSETSTVFASAMTPSPATPRAAINTDAIVARNLFDPERGAGATRDAEESSHAAQRVRNLVLVGTIIIGNDKFAILQDGIAPVAGAKTPRQTQSAVPVRLRIGDSVDGFRLTEIADRRVVFSKDAARVEILLDYFRKTELAAPKPQPAPVPVVAPGAPVSPQPRVVPNLPRRARIPIPPNQQQPDS